MELDIPETLPMSFSLGDVVGLEVVLDLIEGQGGNADHYADAFQAGPAHR